MVRAAHLKYDESDDYDEIETKSDSKNKINLKYANIIIDKIMELKLKGVKIQAVRIKKNNKDCVLAHGIFWVENDIGLQNVAILLAHLSELSEDKNVYFSKIALKNDSFDIHNLEVVSEYGIKLFTQ